MIIGEKVATASFSTCFTERSTFMNETSLGPYYNTKCLNVLPLIFMVTCNLGVKVNVIFILSNKHNHVWCSVNHSDFTGLETLYSPRSKFNYAKENQQSKQEPLSQSLIFDFLVETIFSNNSIC